MKGSMIVNDSLEPDITACFRRCGPLAAFHIRIVHRVEHAERAIDILNREGAQILSGNLLNDMP